MADRLPERARGMGDNQPPVDERIVADLLLAELITPGPENPDLDLVQRMVVWIKRARAIRDRATSSQKDARAPHTAAAKLAAAPYLSTIEDMQKVIDGTTELITPFVTDHGTVRSDYGPAAHLQFTNVAVIIPALLSREYLQPNVELITAALKADKVVPGAVLKPKLRVMVK